MPSVLILILLILFFIFAFNSFLRVLADEAKAIDSIPIVMFILLTIWFFLPHDWNVKHLATFELEKRDNAMFYAEGHYLRNATSLFGRTDLDPEKHEIHKYGVGNYYSYGRLMIPFIERAQYIVVEKMNVE